MKLLTAKEVAEIIGCSEKTIYNWHQTGYAGFPAGIKFGKGRKSLLRFKLEKIVEWIQHWEEKSRGTVREEPCYNETAETVAKPRKGAD